MLHLYLELPSWAFLERMVSYFTHLTESTRSSYILGVLDLLASLDSLWEVAEASMPGLAFGLVGLMEAPSLALRLAIVARFAPPNSFIDQALIMDNFALLYVTDRHSDQDSACCYSQKAPHSGVEAARTD